MNSIKDLEDTVKCYQKGGPVLVKCTEEEMAHLKTNVEFCVEVDEKVDFCDLRSLEFEKY